MTANELKNIYDWYKGENAPEYSVGDFENLIEAINHFTDQDNENDSQS